MTNPTRIYASIAVDASGYVIAEIERTNVAGAFADTRREFARGTGTPNHDGFGHPHIFTPEDARVLAAFLNAWADSADRRTIRGKVT